MVRRNTAQLLAGCRIEETGGLISNPNQVGAQSPLQTHQSAPQFVVRSGNMTLHTVATFMCTLHEDEEVKGDCAGDKPIRLLAQVTIRHCHHVTNLII